MRNFLFLIALPVCFVLSAGEFSVSGSGNDLVIKYNNEVLVRAVDITVPAPPNRFEHKVLPDGTKVWNAWNDDPQHKYRREIALRKDNVVEISMACDVPIFNKDRTRGMTLQVPYSAVEQGKYQALAGNGRDFRKVTGEFKKDQRNKMFPKTPWRFMALEKGRKKLIFDFCPFGAGDYCTTYRGGAVRGVWNVERTGDILKLSSSTFVPESHDFTGLKVLIREGEFSDYDSLHAQRSFKYSDAFAPLALYSFGKSEVGDVYKVMNDQACTPGNRAGWLKNPELKAYSSHHEGAYYSHLAGRNAVFRQSGLVPGFYIVTVGAGNGAGTANNFSVTVNGETLEKNISVKPGTMHLASRVFHIGKDGVLDVRFDGDFIVSAIGLQFLMADAEDFFCNRGFWNADGFEPGSIYRNIDYKKPPVWTLATDTFALPTPGKEAAGPIKKLKKEVLLPDPKHPQLSWINGGHWFKMLSNSSTLSEAATPAEAEALLRKKTAGKKYSAVMISGMHSRHTYINHVQRGIDAIKVLSDAAEKFDLKLIDHHDSTLCWNVDAGFRALGELLHEASRDLVTMLPSYQLCPSNPAFNERYYNYLIELVKAGVDGFQIDELRYWANGCGCQHCRKMFLEATGCCYPVNELDKAAQNFNSEVRRQWFNWQKSAVVDWFIELRKRCMPYNRNLVLSMYTTHWGFTRSLVRHKSNSCLFEKARTINYFGTEVMTRNPLMCVRSLLPHRRMKNVLKLTYDSPVWAWIYATGYPRIYAGWAISNMANQVALLPEITIKPGEADFMKFDTGKNNMPRVGVKAYTKTAVLFSQASRDWISRISFDGELFGLAQTLDDLHISYEFICDDQLNDKDLSKYSVLMLSTNSCMSSESIQAIRSFADRGGTVVMAALAGVSDELGRSRAKWPFRDIFKFAPRPGRVRKIKTLISPNGVRPVAPMSVFNIGKVKDAGLFAYDAKKRPHPLLVERTFGKGRMIYISTVLGAPLWEREGTYRASQRPQKWDHNLDKLYKDIISGLVKDGRVWFTDAPAMVKTALWQGKDKLYVHFFNATGVNIPDKHIVTPDEPKVPYPPLSRDITFSIKDAAKAAEAVAYSADFTGGRKLKSHVKDGSKIFVLPKELLKVYTIVQIK